MKQSAALFALVVVALSSCTRAKPTVILDGWWDRDFAKETCSHANLWLKDKDNAAAIARLGCDAVVSCPELTSIADHCLGDPTQQVRNFEDELATEFASNPQCEAVNFVRLYDPERVDPAVSKAMEAPYWSLSLQFVPGANQQEWQMLHSHNSGGFTKGAGQPDEIARKVCAIVSGRGAALAN